MACLTTPWGGQGVSVSHRKPCETSQWSYGDPGSVGAPGPDSDSRSPGASLSGDVNQGD